MFQEKTTLDRAFDQYNIHTGDGTVACIARASNTTCVGVPQLSRFLPPTISGMGFTSNYDHIFIIVRKSGNPAVLLVVSK